MTPQMILQSYQQYYRKFQGEGYVHRRADKLGEWQSTHEIDEGIFGDKLANVEDGTRPRVLRAGQA